MQVTKDVVSVSEMARMLGFSRARFYQLVRDGVLPRPTPAGQGKRPYYSREQQEQCIEVRRTNRGINGQAILFYAMRPQPQAASHAVPVRQRRTSSSGQTNRQPSPDATMIRDLHGGLSQLGLSNVTDQSIRLALADAYPDGMVGVDPAELLRSVFGRLNRQNTRDNVT